MDIINIFYSIFFIFLGITSLIKNKKVRKKMVIKYQLDPFMDKFNNIMFLIGGIVFIIFGIFWMIRSFFFNI